MEQGRGKRLRIHVQRRVNKEEAGGRGEGKGARKGAGGRCEGEGARRRQGEEVKERRHEVDSLVIICMSRLVRVQKTFVKHRHFFTVQSSPAP